MKEKIQLKRDREVTRYIHRLFREAALKDRRDFVLMFIFWPAQFFLMQIFIPLQIAFSLQAIYKDDTAQLHQSIIMILIATVVQTICLAGGTYTFDKQSAEGASFIQKKIFRNFLKKDYEFYANNFVGSLGAQAANFREAFLAYDRVVFFEVPRMAVLIFGGIAVLAFHSLELAAITAVCVLVMVGYILLSSGYRLRYRRIVSNITSELSGVLGDALGHGETVKSFAAQAYEEERLKEPLGRWHKEIRRMWDSFIPAGSGRNVLNAAIITVLLLATAHLYTSGAIPLAIVALVQLYVIRLIMATQEIMEHIKTYEAAMSMAHQPAETMMIKSEVNDPSAPQPLPNPETIELSLQNVGYKYTDSGASEQAVRDFSLSIRPGEKVGLVGYSGSGKTTLTKLLMRFMDVTSGTIEVNGTDMRNLAQDELRSRIAYVPQEPLLFHRSIFENIAYGKIGATKSQVKMAAKLAYVDEFVADMPKGYQTMVGERGVKLSGGQRQRVAIARAILRDAPLLILDEATSALDSRSELRIQDALAELMKNRTALVIAHRLSTIQRMDRIVVMDKGKIIQTGSHTELLKDKKGVYSRLWQHQSGGYLGATDDDSVQ